MFLAKSYCDIGNSQSSSSIVAPDGEITTILIESTPASSCPVLRNI